MSETCSAGRRLHSGMRRHRAQSRRVSGRCCLPAPATRHACAPCLVTYSSSYPSGPFSGISPLRRANWDMHKLPVGCSRGDAMLTTCGAGRTPTPQVLADKPFNRNGPGRSPDLQVSTVRDMARCAPRQSSETTHATRRVVRVVARRPGRADPKVRRGEVACWASAQPDRINPSIPCLRPEPGQSG